MKFYTSIAAYYDNIFPLNPAQVDFVEKLLPKTGMVSILDVGCGTGNLCIALADLYNNVEGIDPDEAMLKIAISKSEEEKGARFHKSDMLDIGSNFPESSFDSIICIGNTLVHLPTHSSIESFLHQSYKLLKPGGKLLIQIINYDRIIDQDIKFLPTIENNKIKFERDYKIHASQNKIDFITTLNVKHENQIIQNKIELITLRKSEITHFLLKSGFSDYEFYGNFKMDQFKTDSIPLVIEATKSQSD